MRTHFCGLIDESLVGQTVTLCGWVDVARDLGGLCFIDLRDHEGIVQVVAEQADVAGNAAVVEAAASGPRRLPAHHRHLAPPFGEREDPHRPVEVVATQIEMLNKAAHDCRSRARKPGEDIRLKYRYLDLRRPRCRR